MTTRAASTTSASMSRSHGVPRGQPPRTATNIPTNDDMDVDEPPSTSTETNIPTSPIKSSVKRKATRSPSPTPADGKKRVKADVDEQKSEGEDEEDDTSSQVSFSNV